MSDDIFCRHALKIIRLKTQRTRREKKLFVNRIRLSLVDLFFINCLIYVMEQCTIHIFDCHCHFIQ